MSLAVRPEGRTRSVRCPECRTPRTVSLEQAIRIQKGVHSAKCQLCRNPGRPANPTERDRRWWLTQAGVSKAEIASAGGPDAYVRQHGLPAKLEPIVAGAAYLSA